VPGSVCIPLNRFPAHLPEVDPHRPLAVHCKSGYRSTIACGLLARAGAANILNVAGGFDAWRAAGMPEEPGDTKLQAAG
jgi:rhodanese-related sulfurtransferase